MSRTEIITLVCTLIPLIPSIIGTVIGIVKAIKNKDWSKIKEVADTAMKTVEEKAKNGELTTSQDKLNCAIEIVKKTCGASKWTEEKTQKLIQYINSSIDWLNNMKK